MKKFILHSVVLIAGISIGYALNYIGDSGPKLNSLEQKDISFYVYEIRSQLSEDFESFHGSAARTYQLSDGKEIDVKFNTSIDDKTKLPIVKVYVDDESINIDRNGTAVIDNLLISLIDLDAYSRINKEYIAGVNK
ncbi:hypothetical protein LZP69_07755 [Shewanella sp. AS1]|uniref:hypothetical protein n=1 Tax=Shewanella sp. AS1 TaxID=2907626 RepID=UPI001F4216FD|nr:hypothetical protein [Shewanella sp. AS1]MCE9679073.1 hypothetical protein [Shewanella sp. AS1]